MLQEYLTVYYWNYMKCGPIDVTFCIIREKCNHTINLMNHLVSLYIRFIKKSVYS